MYVLRLVNDICTIAASFVTGMKIMTRKNNKTIWPDVCTRIELTSEEWADIPGVDSSHTHKLTHRYLQEKKRNTTNYDTY